MSKNLQYQEGSTLPAESQLFLNDMLTSKAELPLFDSEYYKFQLPEFARSIDNSFAHFLAVGENLGLSPHPIYDPKYVLEQIINEHSDSIVSKAGFSPFVFIQDKNISPNRLFSPIVYLKALAAAGVKLPSKKSNPVSHFLAKWTDSNVDFSEYFDVRFYMQSNPHIASGNVNPLDHYFRSPIGDRSDANPMFHSGYYLLNYVSSAEDPLIDFLAYGHAQLYLPNPYAEQELISSACITPLTLLNYISSQDNKKSW